MKFGVTEFLDFVQNKVIPSIMHHWQNLSESTY
jgi:hypothetical protein